MSADWDVSGFRDQHDRDPEVDWQPRRRRRRFGWPRSRRARFGLIVGLVALGIVGAFVWSGGDRSEHELAGETPMIRADETPVRIPPESPGGLEIPHRDKLVYQRLPGGEPGKLERLLPPPEEPLPPPVPEPAVQPDEAAPSPASRSAGREALNDDAADGGRETSSIFTQGLDQPAPRPTGPAPGSASLSPRDSATQAPRPLTPPPAASSAVPRSAQPANPQAPREEAAGPRPLSPQAPPAQSSPAPLPPAKTALATPPAPAPQTAPNGGGRGGYMVQLVAVSSAGQAQGVWTSLRNRNSDLLGGLSPTFVRADLGAKGSIYRLRAGPLESEARARAMCAELAKRNVDCIIVRPDG